MKYLTILLVAFTAGVIASPAKAKAKAAGYVLTSLAEGNDH